MYTYSPEDLICYLYKETNAQTTAAIEEALQQDWTLREKLTVLKASMERLEAIKAAPRTETVLNVLKYAAAEQKVSS